MIDTTAGHTAVRRDGHNGKRTIRVVLVGTPLYAEPAETSPPLAYLNRGTTLEVLNDRGDFVRVRMHDATVGYVRGSCAVAARQEAKIRLAQAALEVFATKGYHDAKIGEVAERAGYTRNIVRYYYSSKEELGYAAIEVWMQAVVEQGAVSHLGTDEHPIDRLIRALDDLPSAVRIGATEVVLSAMAARMGAVHEGFRQRLERVAEAAIQQAEETVRIGVAEGKIRQGVDPDQLAHLYVTIGMGIQYTSQLMRRDGIWQDARRWMKEYLNSLRT